VNNLQADLAPNLLTLFSVIGVLLPGFRISVTRMPAIKPENLVNLKLPAAAAYLRDGSGIGLPE
jgi:hypothetical protein